MHHSAKSLYDSAWSVCAILPIFATMKTDKKTSSQMAADEATAADGLATQRHARAMRYTEQLLEQLVLEEHADRLAQQAETGDAYICQEWQEKHKDNCAINRHPEIL